MTVPLSVMTMMSSLSQTAAMPISLPVFSEILWQMKP